MKRRKPRELPYAVDGPNGCPAAEIAKRWMAQAKRRLNRLERREGKREARKDW